MATLTDIGSEAVKLLNAYTAQEIEEMVRRTNAVNILHYIEIQRNIPPKNMMYSLNRKTSPRSKSFPEVFQIVNLLNQSVSDTE